MSEIKNLKNLLNIEKISDNRFRASVNEFGWTRVFGGLIVAQSIIASCRTVKDKNLHSLPLGIANNFQKKYFYREDMKIFDDLFGLILV